MQLYSLQNEHSLSVEKIVKSLFGAVMWKVISRCR